MASTAPLPLPGITCRIAAVVATWLPSSRGPFRLQTSIDSTTATTTPPSSLPPGMRAGPCSSWSPSAAPASTGRATTSSHRTPCPASRYTLAATAFGFVIPYLMIRTRNGFAWCFGLHRGFSAADATIAHLVG